MNRIVLIGNGFDLAHGLPTRYEDFINWYWDQRVRGFCGNTYSVSRDQLCEFRIDDSFSWNTFYYNYVGPQPLLNRMGGRNIIHNILQSNYGIRTKHSFSRFFNNIITSIETKGWVDIENEYYSELKNCIVGESLNKTALKDLNTQFHFLTELLVGYLRTINSSQNALLDDIWNIIYSPIKQEEISIEGRHFVDEFIEELFKKDESAIIERIEQFGLKKSIIRGRIKSVKALIRDASYKSDSIVLDYLLYPDSVVLLNFNYTYTADQYQKERISNLIHIHGEISTPEGVIFGYGDELDDRYKQLQNLNENECLRNIKSIKYLESDNYRNVLRFLESAPFQVYIMGHSCGNSDRTLLNTIFEHKNCISIKPYFHKKENGTDNYLDIIQNISRNFTNMKLMRDRVVNKTYCEPLPQTK